MELLGRTQSIGVSLLLAGVSFVVPTNGQEVDCGWEPDPEFLGTWDVVAYCKQCRAKMVDTRVAGFDGKHMAGCPCTPGHFSSSGPGANMELNPTEPASDGCVSLRGSLQTDLEAAIDYVDGEFWNKTGVSLKKLHENNAAVAGPERLARQFKRLNEYLAQLPSVDCSRLERWGIRRGLIERVRQPKRIDVRKQYEEFMNASREAGRNREDAHKAIVELIQRLVVNESSVAGDLDEQIQILEQARNELLTIDMSINDAEVVEGMINQLRGVQESLTELGIDPMASWSEIKSELRSKVGPLLDHDGLGGAKSPTESSGPINEIDQFVRDIESHFAPGEEAITAEEALERMEAIEADDPFEGRIPDSDVMQDYYQYKLRQSEGESSTDPESTSPSESDSSTTGGAFDLLKQSGGEELNRIGESTRQSDDMRRAEQLVDDAINDLITGQDDRAAQTDAEAMQEMLESLRDAEYEATIRSTPYEEMRRQLLNEVLVDRPYSIDHDQVLEAVRATDLEAQAEAERERLIPSWGKHESIDPEGDYWREQGVDDPRVNLKIDRWDFWQDALELPADWDEVEVDPLGLIITTEGRLLVPFSLWKALDAAVRDDQRHAREYKVKLETGIVDVQRELVGLHRQERDLRHMLVSDYPLASSDLDRVSAQLTRIDSRMRDLNVRLNSMKSSYERLLH